MSAVEPLAAVGSPDELRAVLVADAGGDTEGPVWHPEGHLTFVRFRSSELVRWDPDGGLRTIRADTGGGNGCVLDRTGALVMCESDRRRVTRQDPAGPVSVVSDGWQGKRLNKPNDVICRSDGTLYFTDPQAWVPVADREIGFGGVFAVPPGGGPTVLATDECEYPNGLALCPDESVLYVAVTRRDEGCFAEIERGDVCPHRRIRAFDVAADGSLSGHRLFADMSSAGPAAPDGIKVDAAGRVYCTGTGGIWVFEPTGVRIGVIPTPAQPRNLTFGGPDGSTLYVAAGTGIYAVPTRTTAAG